MKTAPIVLIIDDEEVVTYAYNHVLTKRGYKVSIVKDALNILDTAATIAPDLILMDYNMPGMNGADAIKQLKGDPRYSAIPVILFSANKDVETLAVNAGADGWFSKTDDYLQLVALVDKVIK